MLYVQCGVFILNQKERINGATTCIIDQRTICALN